jgi:hypothetical protein
VTSRFSLLAPQHTERIDAILHKKSDSVNAVSFYLSVIKQAVGGNKEGHTVTYTVIESTYKG